MSEADKMLEEAGYTKNEEDNSTILYGRNPIIEFDLENKTISKCDDWGAHLGITMEELNAINKKVEELKWKN